MNLRVVIFGLLFALMWSSAFASARIIVAEAPPLSALALRFVLAGLIGVGLARALGQDWHLSARQWRATVVFGICQNALYLGLYFIAMQTVEASLAAIIASTMPLMVAFAGWLIFGESVPRLGVLGLIAGVIGVAIIMGSRLQGGADPFGVLLCVLGVAALAAATLSMRGTAGSRNFLMVVGLQMLIGAAALAPFALVLENWDVTWTPRLALAFGYTVLIPGLAATLVWFLLVDAIGAVRAATFHFLNPFFGVAIAAVLLGEALKPLDLIGVVIIAGGILAVQLARQTALPPAK